MASPATSDLFTKPIRTAACLIIGDEVLNGKVCVSPSPQHPRDDRY